MNERLESDVFSGLTAVMANYLSPVSVAATLDVVLEKMMLSAATLGPQDVGRVVAEAMIGLRLFCDPENLPELMLDLADYCEEVGADGGN